MILLKRFLFILLSLVLIFNFSYSIQGGKGDSDITYTEESSGNKEGGGNDTDNYTNTFWYGKVEDIDGKFGISICVNYLV